MNLRSRETKHGMTRKYSDPYITQTLSLSPGGVCFVEGCAVLPGVGADEGRYP